jgi:hypothetical protein
VTDSAAWVSAFGELSTGVAAAVAGWAAVRGLGAWRAETVGRRKAELAEEVLAQFYRARDVMTWARFPGDIGLYPSEATGSGEAVERLARESQLFSQLQASRYRFMAYFGEDAAKPFDELRKMHREVLDAADSLARTDPSADGASRVDRAAWSATIGRGDASQEDELASRLDRTIREVERICRPLIDEGRRAGFFRAAHGRRKHGEN